MSYVKLYSTILDSSIWQSSLATRILWVTMLAMSSKEGVVHASRVGLARRANISLEEFDAAIAELEGPDPDSKDGTDGIRVEHVQGAWLIKNFEFYREARSLDAIRKAQQRLRAAGKQVKILPECPGLSRHVQTTSSETSPSPAPSPAPEKKQILVQVAEDGGSAPNPASVFDGVDVASNGAATVQAIPLASGSPNALDGAVTLNERPNEAAAAKSSDPYGMTPTGKDPDVPFVAQPEPDQKSRGRRKAQSTPESPATELEKSVQDVFQYWATSLWPKVHPDRAPKASDKRMAKIRARLADGYSVEDLKAVVDRVVCSPYHLGDNDSRTPYIELETIMRNGEKVDQWLAKACPVQRGAPIQRAMSLDEAMR